METLSAVIQYYRTIGKIWDSLYAKQVCKKEELDDVDEFAETFLLEWSSSHHHSAPGGRRICE